MEKTLLLSTHDLGIDYEAGEINSDGNTKTTIRKEQKKGWKIASLSREQGCVGYHYVWVLTKEGE